PTPASRSSRSAACRSPSAGHRCFDTGPPLPGLRSAIHGRILSVSMTEGDDEQGIITGYEKLRGLMSESTSRYWKNALGGPVSRRKLFRAAGATGAGLAGAALIGCGGGESNKPATTAPTKAATSGTAA